jgi:hypothetical protein
VFTYNTSNFVKVLFTSKVKMLSKTFTEVRQLEIKYETSLSDRQNAEV